MPPSAVSSNRATYWTSSTSGSPKAPGSAEWTAITPVPWAKPTTVALLTPAATSIGSGS